MSKKSKLKIKSIDKSSNLIFFKEGGNCFVAESYTVPIIGPVTITRQCNTRRYGDLDKYLLEKIPYVLEKKPITVILPRWYEYRNIHTYLSYGDYSIGIKFVNEEDNEVMYLDTNYHLFNKNYIKEYRVDDEEKLESLVEVFS